MEILGHSTVAMVKRYQHVLPGLTVAAAEGMDRVMGRRETVDPAQPMSWSPLVP